MCILYIYIYIHVGKKDPVVHVKVDHGNIKILQHALKHDNKGQILDRRSVMDEEAYSKPHKIRSASGQAPSHSSQGSHSQSQRWQPPQVCWYWEGGGGGGEAHGDWHGQTCLGACCAKVVIPVITLDIFQTSVT